MKKGIVIIGPAESGKSCTARTISTVFPKENVAFIEGWKKGPHSLAKLLAKALRELPANKLENLELLVIENITRKSNIEAFMMWVSEGIVIKQKIGYITIYPQIVLVCSGEITRENIPTGSSFTRRFDIVECR